jgi:hypothetical protein
LGKILGKIFIPLSIQSCRLVEGFLRILMKVNGDSGEDELSAVTAIPFLWDASERNVIVFNGKITGIVDVDDICFGNPLFVLALTHAALALEGLDTLYTDYWEQALHPDKKAQRHLKFYRLFYAVVFMRKHAMQTTNSKKVMFDTERLYQIFQQALEKMEKDLY